ncbi:MAG: hypothetical protein ACJ8MH_12010 [Povalibacter sp.]
MTFSSVAFGAESFREPLRAEAFLKKPIVVYARLDDHGVGVQFHKKSSIKPFAVGTVGLILMGPPGAAMGSLAGASRHWATQLSIESADTLTAMFDWQTTQKDFEQALLTHLAGTTFAQPIQLKTLPADFRPEASRFAEDPVLVVELYFSVTPSYRAVQVTALSYALSRSKRASDSMKHKVGRLYLNRFDYISEQLPEPTPLSDSERREKLQALELKYSGPLSDEQAQERKRLKRRLDHSISPFAEGAAELLDVWLADDAIRLRRELKAGTDQVAQLLARDLADPSATRVPSSDTDVIDVLETGNARQTIRYLAGPFAGAVVSQPIAVEEAMCNNITFSDKLSDLDTPDLCEARDLDPGATCPEGSANLGVGCQKIRTVTKRRR